MLQKKFERISDHLYVTSSIKGDDIPTIVNEIRPSLLVNFRKKTTWYDDKLQDYRNLEIENPKHRKLLKIGYEPGVTKLTFDSEFFEIPQGGAAENIGELQKLCKRIVVEYMQQDKRVLLCCSDGISTCGYIATVCQWWYEGGDMSRDLVQELKARHDLITAKDKHQKRQMTEIMHYAKNIVTWKGFCSSLNK